MQKIATIYGAIVDSKMCCYLLPIISQINFILLNSFVILAIKNIFWGIGSVATIPQDDLFQAFFFIYAFLYFTVQIK